MFCGYFAVISAFNGDFWKASWSILIAMIFDSMDGRIARLTRATSAFGLQYDSLSDLVSFGIAPALVAYLWCLEPYGRLGWLAAFLYIVCAALRLARFNIRAEVVSKNFFQGAPSPMAAGMIASFIIFYSEMKPDLKNIGIDFAPDMFMLVLLLLMSSLMISTIRFYSFKELPIKKENPFGLLAVGILLLILIAIKPEVTIFGFGLLYLLINLFSELFRILPFKKRQSRSLS